MRTITTMAEHIAAQKQVLGTKEAAEVISAKPDTPGVLAIYTDFVHERQRTFLAKMGSPLYVSPTLGYDKFTNVQRVFDWTSRYELINVIYKGVQDPWGVLQKIFLFNQFKTAAFWDLLQASGIKQYSDIPQMVANYQRDYPKGDKLFTTAYVVPGKAGEPKAVTITNRCQLLGTYRSAVEVLIADKDILGIYNLLTTIPGIGGFLASQCCFDFLWHESTAGWEPLYKLGVGALRGAYKLGLISRWDKAADAEAIYALDTAKGILEKDYPFATANGQPVPLQVADVQNTFCETDKRLRTLLPWLKAGNSSPTNIKGTYKPGIRPELPYVVPGFWVGSEGLVTLDA